MANKCRNCNNFEVVEDERGHCHADPPRVTVDPASFARMSTWPDVLKTDHCARWVAET